MSITSLQACMDSSNWLQGGAISDDNTGLLMDSSSPITTPTGDDFLPCSGPLVQRRLRPNHDQPLKCPRCESTHTKFCYYNNYNLTQPRYFCKTCRRYWTKGGTLRNIPVGGGCRKNKKVSSNSKKQSTPSSSSDHHNINLHRPFQSQTATDLHLAFPEQLRFSSIHGAGSFNPANTGFLFENMIMNPVECMGMETPIHDNFHGNGYNNNNNNNNIDHHPFDSSSFEHGTGDMSGGAHHILESYQRLMLPYDDESNHYRYHHLDQNQEVDDDVKPNAKILSLEWHDCNSDAGSKDPFRYNLGGLGSWTGLMSGYGSSATNPLV